MQRSHSWVSMEQSCEEQVKKKPKTMLLSILSVLPNNVLSIVGSYLVFNIIKPNFKTSDLFARVIGRKEHFLMYGNITISPNLFHNIHKQIPMSKIYNIEFTGGVYESFLDKTTWQTSKPKKISVVMGPKMIYPKYFIGLSWLYPEKMVAIQQRDNEILTILYNLTEYNTNSILKVIYTLSDSFNDMYKDEIYVGDTTAGETIFDIGAVIENNLFALDIYRNNFAHSWQKRIFVVIYFDGRLGENSVLLQNQYKLTSTVDTLFPNLKIQATIEHESNIDNYAAALISSAEFYFPPSDVGCPIDGIVSTVWVRLEKAVYCPEFSHSTISEYERTHFTVDDFNDYFHKEAERFLEIKEKCIDMPQTTFIFKNVLIGNVFYSVAITSTPIGTTLTAASEQIMDESIMKKELSRFVTTVHINFNEQQ